MHASIVLTSAMLLAQGVMAQYDVFCGVRCQQLVSDCCNHNNDACGKLSNICHANWVTNACSDHNGACVTYCSLPPIANCINHV